jgi:hypothetical protein
MKAEELKNWDKLLDNEAREYVRKWNDLAEVTILENGSFIIDSPSKAIDDKILDSIKREAQYKMNWLNNHCHMGALLSPYLAPMVPDIGFIINVDKLGIPENYFPDEYKKIREAYISVLEKLKKHYTEVYTKPTVKHGTYIANPVCEICHCDLTHKWLDGDYTLLLCDKKECHDTHSEQIHTGMTKMYNQEVNDIARFVESSKKNNEGQITNES